MRNFTSAALFLTLAICGTASTFGQEMELPKPGPEMNVLKADVGAWDVEIKTWTGPGEPTVTKGKERNRMLGGFWLLTNFQGKMMGLDFKGHGAYSYDSKKKQYVGTWIDSLSPTKMDMVGKYDKEKKTMTYEGMAPGEDGTPTKHVLKTTYNNDGTHVMTMHVQGGPQMVKVFEMKYTKAAKAKRSKSKPKK